MDFSPCLLDLCLLFMREKKISIVVDTNLHLCKLHAYINTYIHTYTHTRARDTYEIKFVLYLKSVINISFLFILFLFSNQTTF